MVTYKSLELGTSQLCLATDYFNMQDSSIIFYNNVRRLIRTQNDTEPAWESPLMKNIKAQQSLECWSKKSSSSQPVDVTCVFTDDFFNSGWLLVEI